jgi:TDG/mug DNA glycosylase family protein
MRTLPDYLRPGLDVVFVGINPGTSSVEAGHYFASPANRFWPALDRSGLVAERLGAQTDHLAVEQGIGFTDVVKRPTSSASMLRAGDYRTWAPVLREKLERYRPLIACFHGVTAYRGYLRYAHGSDTRPKLGRQTETIGTSGVFVVPNPSPANAAYSLDTLAEWYMRLKEYRDELKGR